MGAILWTEHLSPRQGPRTQQLPHSSWRVGGGQSYPNPDPDPSLNPDPSPKQGQELYLGGGEGLKKHLGVHDPDAFYLPSGSGSEEALLTSRCNHCPVCPPSGRDRAHKGAYRSHTPSGEKLPRLWFSAGAPGWDSEHHSLEKPQTPKRGVAGVKETVVPAASSAKLPSQLHFDPFPSTN